MDRALVQAHRERVIISGGVRHSRPFVGEPSAAESGSVIRGSPQGTREVCNSLRELLREDLGYTTVVQHTYIVRVCLEIVRARYYGAFELTEIDHASDTKVEDARVFGSLLHQRRKYGQGG